MKPKKPRITPEHLSEHVRPVIHVYQALEEELFRMMAKRLSQGIPEDPDNVLQWQADKLQQIGLLDRQTIRELSKATGQAEKAIRKALEEIGYKTIESVDYELSDVYEPRPVPSQIDVIMEGYVNQTFRELDNFVNQTLITTSQGTGSVARTYQRIVEESTGKVLAGVSTVRKAVAETVINWANRGIASGFTDRGGRTWSMEAYARTVIRSTANRTYNELRMSRMEEYDVHLVVMSSLPSARPACAPIQGKVVSTEREPRDPQYPSIYDYGYGEPWGVRGINCRHMFFPFIEGVNINNQPQVDVDEAEKRHKEIQKQRYYERKIRKAKRSLKLAKEIGDEETIKRYSNLVRNRQAKLRQYIADHDLPRMRDREQIYS